MVLNFLNLVLKVIEKLWKMIFLNAWEPCVCIRAMKVQVFLVAILEPGIRLGCPPMCW